jgi:hypothetical protein
LVHFDSVRISTAPRLSRHVTRSHARSIRMIWTVCIAVWELLRELNWSYVYQYILLHEARGIVYTVRSPELLFLVLVPKNIRFTCFERSILDQNLRRITDLVPDLEADR